MREDAIVIVKGRVDHRGDDVKFIAQEIREPELTAEEMVRLRVPATVLSRNMVGSAQAMRWATTPAPRRSTSTC